MRKPYSGDLRGRALGLLDAGHPVGEVAALFGVHRTTLLRWRQRRALGELTPRPRPGRTPKIGRAEQPRLVAQVQAAPDATLAEHCATWLASTGVAVSEATMCRALKRARWPLKKRA
jgi:transposase